MGQFANSKSYKMTFIKCLFCSLIIGLPTSRALADANVPCASSATILNTTVFGGSYTTSNICEDNVTITTSGSKTLGGGSETNNTNGIYFAANGPHPPFTFGDGLTVTVTGNNVSAIRTNGRESTYGVYTIATGVNATVTATGIGSDGINVAQSPDGQAGYGRVYIGNGSSISAAAGTAVRVNLTSQAPFYNLAYIGDNATITAGGTGSNDMNTQGYAVYAGNRDNVLTNGTASGTNAVAVIGSGATIKTTGNRGHAVYANKGGVVQLQGGSVEAQGTGADALRAEKKITSGNNNNALGGRIELAGNVAIKAADVSGAYVLHTLGDGSAISSARTNYYVGSDDKLYDGTGTVVNADAKVTTAASGIYDISGNMFAESGLIDLHMADGSVFTGATKLGSYTYAGTGGASVTDARGIINLRIDGAGSAWNMTASSEVSSLTLNRSTVRYLASTGDPTQQSSYKTLTVFGNYTAYDGIVSLNTFLGSDDSPSDLLIIDGGRASGTTSLLINNTGGAGAQTTGNGILVVQAKNSGTTDAGAFALADRVVVNGAYEYFLHHGGNADAGGDPDDQNWYLQGVYTELPGDTPDVDPTPVARPEVLVATAVQPLAIEYGYAMLGTLHERVGETYTTARAPVTEERIVRCGDAAQNHRCKVRVPVSDGTGRNEVRWASSGWARLIGNRGFHEPDNFQRRGPNYDYTFGAIQAGTDIYAREQADGTLDKAGIYAGYGQITSDVSGPYSLDGRKMVGKAGSIDMDVYTVGGYWTHFSPNGWYTDGVVQGSWYTTEAHSVLGQSLKPDGFGILASLEGGYSLTLGNGFTVEPQAQLVYQNVSFDDANDAYGRFAFDDGDSLRGRIGARVTRSWNTSGETDPRFVTAWLRANIWHEFMGKTTTRVGAPDRATMLPFHSYLGGTWADIGSGVTAQVTDKATLFASGAYQRSLDNKGREGWNGRLGMTAKW